MSKDHPGEEASQNEEPFGGSSMSPDCPCGAVKCLAVPSMECNVNRGPQKTKDEFFDFDFAWVSVKLKEQRDQVQRVEVSHGLCHVFEATDHDVLSARRVFVKVPVALAVFAVIVDHFEKKSRANVVNPPEVEFVLKWGSWRRHNAFVNEEILAHFKGDRLLRKQFLN